MRRLSEGLQAQAPSDRAQAAAQRRKAVPMLQVPETVLALGLVQPAHEPQVLVLQTVQGLDRPAVGGIGNGNGNGYVAIDARPLDAAAAATSGGLLRMRTSDLSTLTVDDITIVNCTKQNAMVGQQNPIVVSGHFNPYRYGCTYSNL